MSVSAREGGVRFDHLAPDLDGDAFWDAIRELQSHGPLVWVENYDGYWAATSYDVVLRMAQDWETFSSAQGVALQRPSPEVMPYIMPIDVDPPRQRIYRKNVNPYLVPKVVSPLEASIRDIADELIDTFVERGGCDI